MFRIYLSKTLNFLRTRTSVQIICTILACTAVFLLPSYAKAQPQPVSLSSSVLTKAYSLEDLIGKKDIVLTGLDPSYVFFFQRPQQWHLKAVSLNLIVSHSPVLDDSSTLTLLVNGTPFSTVRLTGKNITPTHWKISLPASYFKKHSTAITIAGYLKISDDICSDLENKGNWVKIGRNSTVNYTYTPKNYQPNLKLLPYPFINMHSPENDNVTLVTPNNLSFNNFKSIFYIASALGKAATWQGITLKVSRLNDLTRQEKSNSNIIFVGTQKELPINHIAKWPLTINTTLANKHGILMAARSPWNPEYALLAITGNTHQAVENAARAFENINDRRVIAENSTYTTIAKAPLPVSKKIDWTNTTFKKLGYSTQVVYGDGQHELNYHFNLPGSSIPNKLKIKLYYKYSRLLSAKKTSHLVAVINGVPIDETKLTRSHKAVYAIWNLNILRKNLKAGQNTVQFVFNLKSLDKGCTRRQFDKVWGVIYDSSTLQLDFDESLPTPILSDYVNYLGHSMLIALPEANAFYSNQQTIANLIQFAKSLTPANVFITNYKHLNNSAQSNYSSTVYLGLPFKNTFISSTLNKSLKDLQKTLKHFSGQSLVTNSTSIFPTTIDEKPIDSLLLITHSSTEPKQMRLVITGKTFQNVSSALNILSDPKKSAYLKGNIAFVYSNGTYTALNTKQLKQAHQIHYTRKYILITICSLLTLFILIAIWLVMRYMKRQG